jgi:hypothetical protein
LVHPAVTHGLRQVFPGNRIRFGQIRNCPGHPNRSVNPTRGKSERFGGPLEERTLPSSQSPKFLQVFQRHLGIALHAPLLAKSFALPFPRPLNPSGNLRRALGPGCRARNQTLRRRPHGGNLHVQIDTIEEGTSDSALVGLHLPIGAAAPFDRMAQESAGTGIHGDNETELTWKPDGPTSPDQTHGSFLQRLTQEIEDTGPKLWDLVQEKNSAVGQTDLARSRVESGESKRFSDY